MLRDKILEVEIDDASEVEEEVNAQPFDLELDDDAEAVQKSFS